MVRKIWYPTAKKEDNAMRNAITSVTDGQVEEILSLIQETGKRGVKSLDKNGAQLILERGSEFGAELMQAIQLIIHRFSATSDTVVVPNISAVELMAWVKKDLNVTNLDRRYAGWDFHKSFDGKSVDGRGKHFEVMIWKPELDLNQSVSTSAVREHFKSLGFCGHVAAFVEWCRCNPNLLLEECYASIPEEHACYRDDAGVLFAPYTIFDADDRILSCAHRLEFDWCSGMCFVAFRELPL